MAQLDVELVLDPLADDERLAVEVDAGGAGGVGDHEVGEGRHRGAGRGAEAGRVDGDVAPPDDVESLVGDDRLDRRPRLLGGDVVVGKERHPDGVGAGRREVDALVPEDAAQEAVGDLDEDPGAVTGVRLGARGPAVLEVGERQRGPSAPARGWQRP